MTKREPIQHTVTLQLPNSERQAFTVSSKPGEPANSEALALAARLSRQHKGEYRVLRVTTHGGE